MAAHHRQERTDRLETTIQSIESLQQTGILKLERAKGGVRETAQIVFLKGKPVEAVAGARTAQDALYWVLAWGSCRYTFEMRFPSEIVVPPPSSATVEEKSSSAFPVTFFSQVAQKYTHSLSTTTETTEEGISPAPFSIPQTPLPPAYPLSSYPQTMGSQVAAVRQHAPFRLLNGSEAINYMERFGLSRLHRHVFFLLDGQRTAVDMVRLTGRSFYEIQGLLMELERLGLIRMEQISMDEAMNGL